MEQFLSLLTKPDNIPIVILLVLTSGYAVLAYRKAKRNDKHGIEEAKQTDRVQVWPYLVKIEFLASLAVMLILTIWSIFINAPLEEPANPTLTPNPSKAPWYFLGLQEMLVYFDPWIAGVVLPSLIIVGLIVIPYIDINTKGNGYYTIKERPFALAMFSFGFLILWVALIMIGTFFRGPGWYFFMPWEFWDVHRVGALTNVDFFEKFGVATKNIDGTLNMLQVILGALLIGGYYSLIGLYWKKKKNTPVLKSMGFTKYAITAFLFVTMMALPIKMILRIGFNIKYVWVTPWFNI